MASNYTTNYQLNQWEAGDQVLRTEFNQDNQKIDTALAGLAGQNSILETALAQKGNCRIELITYTGDGTYGSGHPKTLTFSAVPKAVIIVGYHAIAFLQGGSTTNTMVCSGEGNIDAHMSDLYITWTGNQVRFYANYAIANLNQSGWDYWVLAFYAEDETE